MGIPPRIHATNGSGSPRVAAARKLAPSNIIKAPWGAPHRVCAFSNIASKTAATLPGDELMTCNTSAVAVCWANASSRSALHSASWRCISAMSRSGLANVLSGVALMCADLVGTGLPCRSYRDRHGPPTTAAYDRYRPSPRSRERPESALCSPWLTTQRMPEVAPQLPFGTLIGPAQLG